MFLNILKIIKVTSLVNYNIFPYFFQLYSLNEYKPPISKAKMTQITKSAIKAIKVSLKTR